MCRCRFQKDSEREKQLSYPNTYIWNLEKWCWRTYLQGRNRDTAIEDRLLDTAGEGEGGTNWESSTETYTLPCGRQLTGGAVQHRELNTVVLDNLEGWDVAAAGERSRGRGHIDTYDWRMLSCGRSQFNAVGFPDGSDGRESACNAGDLGSIPGSGTSPGDENGYPLQYSCLENSMDTGAWGATVHGVAKFWTRLSD